MLDIVLTIDIDADVFDESMQTHPYSSLKPSWKGLQEGVPLLIELFDSYKGSDGSACKATWFVRADDQIGYYFGENAYLFSEYKNYWVQLLAKEHEIEWHPHLYEFDGEKWNQQVDPDRLDQQLKASLESIRKKNWEIKASRIGEAYFSNSIAQSLRDLGILCDSSALPGRIRKDGARSIDWLSSPFTPYYPSEKDYRIPGTSEDGLLEIPFSMVEVKADYDTAPLKRYVDLSFWHNSLRKGLSNAIEANAILTTIVHPSSILPSLSLKPHGLLSYSLQEVKKNIDFIIDIADKKGVDYRFKTISQIHNQILNEQ